MGCFAFLKTMMFVFNGIIFVAGIAILGVGIWVKVDSGSIFRLLMKIDNAPPELNQVLNVGYLLIAVGAVLLIIGFLGCCGAIRESRCMLLMFFLIVLLIFIIEIAGAIVILAFRPLADELFEKVGKAAVANIKKDYGKNEDITNLWDTTMDTLKCCGFYNRTDFDDSPFHQTHNGTYPEECCQLSKNCTEPLGNEHGCFQRIKSLIEGNTQVIVGVALGIAVLEICAMVVSMMLYCKIKSEMA